VVAAGIALVTAPAAVVRADEGDEDDTTQTVARVAYISGEVSFNRGDDPDDWQAAGLNFPMTLGDRIFAANDARLVLQLETGDAYLGPETELAALDLTLDTTQLSLTSGIASFRIHHINAGQFFEVDTPNVSITFDTAGYYRIDVDRDGNSHLSVWRGNATAAAGGGQVDLRAGDAIQVDGLDNPEYDVAAAPRSDSWDRWVEQRARHRHREWTQYASSDIVGLDDLELSGRWEAAGSYGWAWTPHSVAAGWQPYRNGRWVWQDPWGWTWIAEEPWGWAPYHYGRWVTWKSRWYWVPERQTVRRVHYSPALVIFLGGGPGWSAAITIGGGGYVGWFPLAPADPFEPWWYHPHGGHAHDTHITYINQTYITVINHDDFVTGRPVSRHFVRDTNIVRQVVTAPTLRGPLPVLPIRESLRVGPDTGTRTVVRPPATLTQRPVVARIAPPVAPPRFDVKLPAIREGGGTPISVREGLRLSNQGGGSVPVVAPIRPATPQEPGRVTFVPRRESITRPVHEITLPAGRPPATLHLRPGTEGEAHPTPHAEGRPSPFPEVRSTPIREWFPTPSTQTHPTPRAERPSPFPEFRPTPDLDFRPTPSVEPRPTTHPERRPTPFPEFQPTPRPERPSPFPEFRPTPRHEERPTPSSQGQPTPSFERRPVTDTQTRPTPRNEGRPTATPTARATATPTPRPTPQPRSRPADRSTDRNPPG
jgi:hypothetical protein